MFLKRPLIVRPMSGSTAADGGGREPELGGGRLFPVEVGPDADAEETTGWRPDEDASFALVPLAALPSPASPPGDDAFAPSAIAVSAPDAEKCLFETEFHLASLTLAPSPVNEADERRAVRAGPARRDEMLRAKARRFL